MGHPPHPPCSVRNQTRHNGGSCPLQYLILYALEYKLYETIIHECVGVCSFATLKDQDTYAPDGLGLVVRGMSDRRGNEAAVLELLPLLKSDTEEGWWR